MQRFVNLQMLDSPAAPDNETLHNRFFVSYFFFLRYTAIKEADDRLFRQEASFGQNVL